MSKYKLSIIIPCYQRPQRTIRAIDCVFNQTFEGYHAMFLFDGCPHYEEHEANGVFDRRYDKSINKIDFVKTEHHGGYGYHQRNLGIQKAEGEYTIFYDNDDVILPNHFENYYNAIAGTPYDMVHFNSYIEPINIKRNSEINFGCIGHSEIIVRTELLKSLPEQTAEYGHDFKMIQQLLWRDAMLSKSKCEPTYIVKSLPNHLEQGID